MSATTSPRISRPRGEILVSDQAIAAIVRGALGEVNGVYGVAPLRAEGHRFNAWSPAAREHTEIGIASQPDGTLHVTLRLIVAYGPQLREVARAAIRAVRERVWTLAGVEIARFDVEVKGLHHSPPASADRSP